MALPTRDFSVLSHRWLTGFCFISRNNFYKGILSCELKHYTKYVQKYHGTAVKSNGYRIANTQRNSQFQFSYHLHNKKFWKLTKILQRCNPSVTQACCYHSFSNNSSHIDRRSGRKCLLTGINRSPLNYITKRQLSLAWVDSLAVTQASWFQALGQSKFVEGLMTGLQGIHDYSHLPWWAAIILSTILIRGVLTFPVAVYQVCYSGILVLEFWVHFYK